MTYVDGFVASVPIANKDAYRKHAESAINSLHTAVMRKDGEAVVFSWTLWPDKATRDAGWQKIMADPRMQPDVNPMPFDGSRMIYGGFEMIVNA